MPTKFIANHAALVLVMLAIGFAEAAWAGQAVAPLQVGVFRCDVTPPPGEPLIWDVPLKEVLSPLLAKGVVIESEGRRYVLCAFDWCEIANGSELAFRKTLAKAARTRVSRVVVHSVHQHAAPYADIDAHPLLDAAPMPPLHLSDRFLEEISRRLDEAVRNAMKHLEPVDQIGVGQARVERVASTRRLQEKDGKITVRYSGGGKDPKLAEAPEGLVDPWLKTITLARGTRPLARLHYYATHPQTFALDGRASSDFVGQAREALETKEGVPQIYFTGCAGDVTAGKYNDGSERARTELGNRLAAGMEAAIGATRWAPATALAWRTTTVRLPARNDAGFAPAEVRAQINNTNASPGLRIYQGAVRLAFAQRHRTLDVFGWKIGAVQVLHLPGEPMLEFQFHAQQLRPDEFVAVAGYGDCGPGYICTDQAFIDGGYEPTDANVGPGSETRLKAAIRYLMGLPSKTKPQRKGN